MKDKFKKIFICFISTFVLATFLVNASAYSLLPYKLTGGVGNWGNSTRYYWIDNSANDYTYSIETSYSEWVHTNHILQTPISWRRTWDKSSGIVELHANYSVPNNAYGQTEFFMYNRQVSPYAENWGWSKVTLSKHYSPSYLKGTTAHEIGHTMGLNHTTYQYAVMCTSGDGRRVTSPQYDDLAGINSKYN